MREAPTFTPTASPWLRRSPSPWPPHRTDTPASELNSTGRTRPDHALHTSPYPSGLSRHWTYGASNSGSSRTPSHHCLPDPGRLTVPTRPVRCRGCSHHRVRSHVPSGSRGALLRPGPLRTARAAFTASSSSKPRGRLRFEALRSCVGEFGARSGKTRERGGFDHRPVSRVSRDGRGSPP